MTKLTKLVMAAAFLIATPIMPAYAQDEGVKAEIKEMFANKAVLLTGETIDIDKMLEEARTYNRDDAVFVNRLTNLANGAVTETSMTKDEMIAKMPDAYSLTMDNEAHIDVTSITAAEEPAAWDVGYQLSFSTTLEQRDVYGRIMSTDMAMQSACIEHMVRSNEDILQTTYSECDAVLKISPPEIKAQ